MWLDVQRHAPVALPPGKDPVPIVQEAGCAPGPVWTGSENFAPPPPGFDPRTVKPVASRYTNWAIPAYAEVLIRSMKVRRGVEVLTHLFLTSALDGGEPMYLTYIGCCISGNLGVGEPTWTYRHIPNGMYSL